jgi:hypothetical protein
MRCTPSGLSAAENTTLVLEHQTQSHHQRFDL